ncbi:hypothetical protein EGI22_13210 [Lacihabitans sp. LS3-19]|uniref:hypothetical protein n=1 Tax=Lacihabitans sp. LS3-19 TaxID=2487335 RepID=UPI0020CC973C|nr:hypothetical protein [Lacihabitans sp. LS3-19]MCP9768874.1 hypothetical protein [Lacihabitans sp. LS3-19]
MKGKIITLILLISFGSTLAQNLITSDLENFKKAYNLLSNSTSKSDSLDIITQNLLNKASPVFQEYLSGKKISKEQIAERYFYALDHYPKYYASVIKYSEIFSDPSQIAKIENAYKRLKRVYPTAKLRPNAICIGFMDDGGQSLFSGQYIGIEVTACSNGFDLSELDQRLLSYFGECKGDLPKIDETITHELVHLSQFKPIDPIAFGKNFNGTIKFIPLLSEGGASFVTDYLFNFKASVFSKQQLEFCSANEEKLWQQFLSDDNFNPYFKGIHPKYNIPQIGYYLGYQVCKSYFNKSKNKKKAIKDIIEVNDWDRFVLKSGYFY